MDKESDDCVARSPRKFEIYAGAAGAAGVPLATLSRLQAVPFPEAR